MTASGVSTYIAESLKGMDISPLLLSWAIAAVIRVCVVLLLLPDLRLWAFLRPCSLMRACLRSCSYWP